MPDVPAEWVTEFRQLQADHTRLSKLATEYRQKWSDEAGRRGRLEQDIRSYLQELVGDGVLTPEDANTWLNGHKIEALVSEWAAAINVTIHVTLESGWGEDRIETALRESLSVDADFFGSGLENVTVDDVDFESVDVSRA